MISRTSWVAQYQPCWNGLLRADNADLELPVVLALSDDSVGDVFKRIDNRAPALVVMFEDDRPQVIRFDNHRATDECEVLDINIESTMGMFLTMLRTYPGTYACRLVTTAGHFELIEDGDAVPV